MLRVLSLVAASGGYSLAVMYRLLITVASAQGQALKLGLSSCGPWGLVACGMWNLPDLGLNPFPMHRQADCYPLYDQGSPHC